MLTLLSYLPFDFSLMCHAFQKLNLNFMNFGWSYNFAIYWHEISMQKICDMFDTTKFPSFKENYFDIV